MHKVPYILLTILIILISLFSLFIASSRFTILWPEYKNKEYGFSLKHPLFLGKRLYDSLPSTFIENSYCDNEFPPPNSSFVGYQPDSDAGYEIESYYSLLENQAELYNFDKFKFLYGSGECDYGADERRKISIYIYNNTSFIPFEEFVENSNKIYDVHFKYEIDRNFSSNHIYDSQKRKITNNGSEGILILDNIKGGYNDNDTPIWPIYYQELSKDKFLVITSSEYDTLIKMISTIKINN